MNRKKAIYIVGVYLISAFLLFPAVLYLYFYLLGGHSVDISQYLNSVVVLSTNAIFVIPILLFGLLLLVVYLLWWGYKKVTYSTSDTVNLVSH